MPSPLVSMRCMRVSISRDVIPRPRRRMAFLNSFSVTYPLPSSSNSSKISYSDLVEAATMTRRRSSTSVSHWLDELVTVLIVVRPFWELALRLIVFS